MRRRQSTILMVVLGIVILIVVVGAGTATWLYMRSSVPITANGQEISLSVDEIERYGPALFLDYMEEDGSRALVWTD